MSPKNHKNHQDQNSDLNDFSINERNKNKRDTLEDGTAAFMKWMGSSDKKSLTSENPIVLIKFVNGNNTLLYDTDMSMPVQVKLIDGVFLKNLVPTSIGESESFRPKGLAVALQTGNLYTKDTGSKDTLKDYSGHLQKFSGSNGNSTQFNLVGLIPKAIAVDTSGKSLFVVGKEDVYVIRGWDS